MTAGRALLALSVVGLVACENAPAPQAAADEIGEASQALGGAGFTTFDEKQGGCLDSTNGVNCNHYASKDDVYTFGGGQSGGLADGTYFFAVIVPGNQNGGFVDGADGNLSDAFAGKTEGDRGSGDGVDNRTFRIVNGDVAYTGTHAVSTRVSGHGKDVETRVIIHVGPFDDTSNAGKNYMLAICEAGATTPSGCKFDQISMSQADPVDAGSPPAKDQPPVAVCTSRDACANDRCVADVSVNDGSYDPDGTAVTLESSPAAPYSLGATDVKLSVSSGGVTATCAGTVRVTDCTPPTIECPADVAIECTGANSADFKPAPAKASDNCSVAKTWSPDAGRYPLGVTKLEYGAVDGADLKASCTSAVAVVDTIPPVITVAASPELWPPNHQYERVGLESCGVSIFDVCAGKLSYDAAGATIVRVTSDEVEDANGNGDGNTLRDMIIVDRTHVDLRAEREGTGDGRVYTIDFVAGDGHGNDAKGSCRVTVPHDQKPGHVSVDGGAKYVVGR